MSSSPAEFNLHLKAILKSIEDLPEEAKAPVLHYKRTITDIWNAINYVKALAAERERPPGEAESHFGRLYGMTLLTLIEVFERFLKEIAAECVDRLADLIIDDRLNAFPVHGATLASHFGAGSAGKALCESSLWLDCREINDRFRKLLADPFAVGSFYIFPKEGNQQPIAGHWRYELMSLLWQLRHTGVHNVCVITKSDAVKLRVLAKVQVDAPRVLVPTASNLLWLKTFLDETVEDCNRRVGERLAELLTTLHAATPLLIEPKPTADQLASIFRLPLVVAGATGLVPMD